jgi:hypothetical protein
MRSIQEEYEGAEFGDRGLNARVKRRETVFRNVFSAESQLEAVYRFVNNDRVRCVRRYPQSFGATRDRGVEARTTRQS